MYKYMFLFSLFFLLHCNNDTLLRAESFPSLDVSVITTLLSKDSEISMPLADDSGHCPADMVYVESKSIHYCIDRYEAPNKKGVYPFYAQTAIQGENYCHSVGKNICTQDQWYIACVGPKWQIYPYGNSYKKGTCNDDKTGWVSVPWLTMGTQAWVDFCKAQYKGEPSGNRPACVSGYGVYDMTGNVAEWVREPKNVHGYVVKGGYWYSVYGGGTPTCGFVNPAHAAGFNSYEFGFRCCIASK